MHKYDFILWFAQINSFSRSFAVSLLFRCVFGVLFLKVSLYRHAHTKLLWAVMMALRLHRPMRYAICVPQSEAAFSIHVISMFEYFPHMHGTLLRMLGRYIKFMLICLCMLILSQIGASRR